MSDTHYHGEEISDDTYSTLRRHQFNLESLEERLQRMENTTATMKEKWRRGDEAMRDFTGTRVDENAWIRVISIFKKARSLRSDRAVYVRPSFGESSVSDRAMYVLGRYVATRFSTGCYAATLFESFSDFS
ncbi:hypothetical protein F2Q69_00042342 [Brassica cretica]|uniref:Uncharacterized protein n=1 Tax=Brassica cretica TaxID=69181 RepID=A0A8S9NDB4_BRACR|nr:hypothetical protein F2Q69_00042342 [Brassica cretica]